MRVLKGVDSNISPNITGAKAPVAPVLNTPLIHENCKLKPGEKMFCTEISEQYTFTQHVLPMFCKKKSFWQRFTFIENFLNIDDLNKHIELDHQTQSVINCEKCQNSYCSTNLLDMHYLEVHSEKRYTCSLCSKSQSSSFKLKSHIDSIHKGIKQVVSKR